MPIVQAGSTPDLSAHPIGTIGTPADLWETSLPDLSALLDMPDDGHKWRREVIQGGKYWQWRTVGRNNRKARYGGTFRTLPQERQAQYHEYKRNKQTQRNALNAR